MRTLSTRSGVASARPERGGGSAAAVAAAVVLVLSVTTLPLANLDSRPGRDFQLHTILLASDLALLVLIGIQAGGLRAVVGAWRHHACALAALGVGLAMVPAALLHPSDRGAAALVRGAGAVAVALAIGTARRDGRRLVVGALAAATLAHVGVAVVQRGVSGPVGLTLLGEAGAHEIGGRYASSGLTVHPYVLAAWCAVAGTGLLALARRRGMPARLATAAGVAAFGGIGLTMSRAGALAAVLALGALAVATRRRGAEVGHRAVLAAAAALAAGGLVNLSGWLARAGQASGTADAVSSGRAALLDQAWGLLGDNLLGGIGPGRYVLALVERPDLVALSSQTPRPVHLTPLLLVVEGGVLVVPALALLAVAVGRACRRGGAPAVAVTLAMVPFLALDHLAWSYPQGLVLAGVWLALLDLLARPDGGPDAEPAGPAAVERAPAAGAGRPAATGPPAAPP